MRIEDFVPSPAQLEAVRLYREWNEKINVVSRKDADYLFEHHILHSLCIAEYVRRFLPDAFTPGQAVLDLGTGGGFPGIPLAMEFPDVRFTLCDSIGKKVLVARSVAESLGLGNVECVNARAESLPGVYDWVVSRAVTSMENFYPWVRGRYRGGVLLLKGGDVNGEISSFCRKCRFKASQVHTWRIDEWIQDDYFAEKFVIQI